MFKSITWKQWVGIVWMLSTLCLISIALLSEIHMVEAFYGAVMLSLILSTVCFCLYWLWNGSYYIRLCIIFYMVIFSIFLSYILGPEYMILR